MKGFVPFCFSLYLFVGCGGLAFGREADAIVFDGDVVVLVEVAHATLEGFLAHAEGVVDVFGIGLVVEWTEAVGQHLEVVEELLAEVGDALLAEVLLQLEVDFAILAHLLDEGGEAVACVERLEDFVLKDESTVALIDNGFHAEFGLLLDEDFDGIARLVWWLFT